MKNHPFFFLVCFSAICFFLNKNMNNILAENRNKWNNIWTKFWYIVYFDNNFIVIRRSNLASNNRSKETKAFGNLSMVWNCRALDLAASFALFVWHFIFLSLSLFSSRASSVYLLLSFICLLSQRLHAAVCKCVIVSQYANDIFHATHRESVSKLFSEYRYCYYCRHIRFVSVLSPSFSLKAVNSIVSGTVLFWFPAHIRYFFGFCCCFFWCVSLPFFHSSFEFVVLVYRVFVNLTLNVLDMLFANVWSHFDWNDCDAKWKRHGKKQFSL